MAGAWGRLEGSELWGWPEGPGRRLRTFLRKDSLLRL